MKTIQNHPFDLILARDAKWPLVTRDGRKAEVLKWDAKGIYPFIGSYSNEDGFIKPRTWAIDGFECAGTTSKEDLFLSADYSDPAVRAAVQLAHDKLAMHVKCKETHEDQWREPFISYQPAWNWACVEYCLAQHVPAPVDPIAPGHNPDKLTVSQVGDGFRLFDHEELRCRNASDAIESWDHICKAWRKYNVGDEPDFTYRTRLSREALAALDAPPKPAWTMPVAPAGPGWHLNDFTEADLPPVTDGGLPWRPLLKDERYIANVDWIDMSVHGRVWEPVNHGGVVRRDTKLRTRRPLPSEPKRRAWNNPEDVPAECWIRYKESLTSHFRIICVTHDLVAFWGHWPGETTMRGLVASWMGIAQIFEYSTDRKTWHPCEVME